MAQARTAVTRQRVLDAALARFAERGFHGTAVPDVARQAQVGAGTLYRHFGDKIGLVNAVFREAKARLQRHLHGALAQIEQPRAAFDALWRGLWNFAEAEPAAFQFLELHDHHYLDDDSRLLEAQILLPLLTLCAEFQTQGVFRASPDAAVLMAMIWGAFVGVIKAARQGYLTLESTLCAQTTEAAWAAVRADPTGGDVG